MSEQSKEPVESYGGAGREAQGGGPAGRGSDTDDAAENERLSSESAESGASGASSAIDDGDERRAGSGRSGSVNVSVPLPPD